MSKYNVVITETAEKDLISIGRYIKEELFTPNIALKLMDKISKEINSLRDMPLRNSLVNDERLADIGLRKIIVDNYIVFYLVHEHKKVVIIVRILYSRRDWINIL